MTRLNVCRMIQSFDFVERLNVNENCLSVVIIYLVQIYVTES